MESKKGNIVGVDIFKFILAFAVIAIHVSADTEPLPMVYEYIVRLAVPFFFITSGYFIARKMNKMESRKEISIMFRKRSIQLFRIFGIWLLIYLPITIYHTMNSHISIFNCIYGYVYSILFYGESYYAWPLWFIYSMAIVMFIFSFCNVSSSKTQWGLFLIFLCLTLISWLNIHYSSHLIAIINKLTSRTLGGGIYIISGIIIYRSKFFMRIGSILGCLIISILLFICKYPCWPLLGGIAIFNIALIINILPPPIGLFLRNQSMWIYYLHMYPLFIVVTVAKAYGYSLKFLSTFLLVSAITLSLTVCIGYIINKYPKARCLTKLIR